MLIAESASPIEYHQSVAISVSPTHPVVEKLVPGKSVAGFVINHFIKLQQIQATEIEVENTPDEEMSDEPADEPEPEIAM